ncbi:MAG: hypothetical protein ABMA00_18480 [Gemmatimonas sp.]
MKRRIPRTIILALVLLGLAAVDGLLLYKRGRYREETERLRAGMSTFERDRTDAIVAAEADRTGLMLQLARRQSFGDEALHLAVSSESSFVALDRGGVRLRVMSARFGPERRVGVPPDTLWVAVPRGMRTVERRLVEADRFELPTWLWTDRGLPQPADRWEVGWLGADALVTSGGTLIYALPTAGPLADSSYVMPGTIRLQQTDLNAIRDNVTLGMRVYFF